MASCTESASGAAPEALIHSTIQTVGHVLGQKEAGVVAARVASLAKEVLRAMLLTRVKVTAIALLMIGTLLAGVGVLARQETAPSGKRHRDSSLLPASKSVDRSSSSRQRPGDSGAQGQRGSDHQPVLRAGGYLFTASPTGNKAIAYDPTTRKVKSVQLNATKEHPLRITPMTGDRVQLVALQIHGSKVTRVAVFDLESDKWLPVDLAEPVKGDVQPVYVGHGGTAYDLGRHFYMFNAKTKICEHIDITTF